MKRWLKRLLIFSLVLLAATAVLLLTNVYVLALKPLDIGVSIPRDYGDVILVMGGGLRPQVLPGYSTKERLDQAIRLYRRKPRHIILADGSLYPGSPARPKLRDYFLRGGVRRNRIIFESRSQNTFRSCANSLLLIRERGFSEVIVVTSPYHQRRTASIMRHLGFGNFMVSVMRDSEIYQADSLKQRMRNLRLIIREYVGLVKFAVFRR